ncbi:unnamed protein product [Cylicocyclus nassatus]|uniref:Rhodanese domain-containing protein n=1 Tax=Cylicocyclus nassatus TaxID=53992 RepID=A0AA36H1N7_CYLNA|nr:unnamed protein product [Cylicocyclus nassatus]
MSCAERVSIKDRRLFSYCPDLPMPFKMSGLLFVLCSLYFLPPILATEDVVSVDWLDKNKDSVKLLDATYQPTFPNYKEFKEKYYGKFEELMHLKSKHSEAYAKEHIPGAVFFDLDAAYYPSQYIRFDLYPPEEFEKYIRLLGINAGDHVVIYARAQYAGMLWAVRVWWTFKLYGHDNVSVLNGGLNAWKKAGKPVSDDVPVVEPGDWKAQPIDKSILITFEELNEKRPGRPSIFDDLSKINLLDGRPASEFFEGKPLQIPTKGVPGYHMKGSKNLPLDVLIGEDGLKSKAVIERALEKAGYNPNLPTVTMCNKGIQASVLALIMKQVGVKARVFNGSLTEVALRAPKLISEK